MRLISLSRFWPHVLSTVKISDSIARYRGHFFKCAALALVVTALLKVVTVFQGAKVLLAGDPLFTFCSNRQVLVLAAVLEVAVVWLLMRPSTDRAKLVGILWLCLVFATYRLGLVWIGFRGYCRCMGSMSEWLHISPEITDAISKGILCVMMIGAVVLLIWEVRFQNRRR